MKDNCDENKIFITNQNKYSTFKNVSFVERKENEKNLSQLIDQKLLNLEPIIENIGNIYDCDYNNNFKKGKTKISKSISLKKNSLKQTDISNDTTIYLTNLQYHFENFSSDYKTTKKANHSNDKVLDNKPKIHLNNTTQNKIIENKTLKNLKISCLLNSSMNSFKESKNKINLFPINKNLIKKQKNSTTFPNIDNKLARNNLENFITQSNIVQKNILETSKFNKSISSDFIRKTNSFIMEVNPFDKPVVKSLYVKEENVKSSNENLKKFNMEEFIDAELRLEKFDKIAKINNLTAFKFGDFIIDNFGYRDNNKKSSFNHACKIKYTPKRSISNNSNLYKNIHFKVERLLENSKNKENYLVDKMDKRIVNLKLLNSKIN